MSALAQKRTCAVQLEMSAKAKSGHCKLVDAIGSIVSFDDGECAATSALRLHLFLSDPRPCRRNLARGLECMPSPLRKLVGVVVEPVRQPPIGHQGPLAVLG